MSHKLLTFLAVLLLCGGLSAQQQLSTIEYFVDEDPGLGQGVVVPVAGAVDTAITFVLPLDTLAFGVHTLYARTVTDSARLSRTQSVTFVKLQDAGVEGFAQFEYFIDEDPGLGNGITLPAANDSLINVSFTIDLNDYLPGLHTFYVRAKNALGLWSFLQSHTFFLLPGEGGGEVVAYEYFIDDDPGIGQGQGGAVPVGDSIDYTFTADLTDVPPGIHTLYVRTKSGGGLWSFTTPHTFLVVEGSSDPAILTDLEYFFDVDPGAGNAQAIAGTGLDTLDIIVPISLSGLTNGDHQLYIRAKDNQNDWSFLHEQTVTVMDSDEEFPEQRVFPTGLNFLANNCYDQVEQTFYLHNDGTTVLNAQLATTQQYFEVFPVAASVFPGDSVLVTLMASPDAVGPGQYFGTVSVTTNDPVTPSTSVTTVFTVQPNVFSTIITPDTLAEGEWQVNTNRQLSFDLLNTSCDTLDLFGLLSSLGNSVSVTPARIGPGESVPVAFTYATSATNLGAFTDTLLVQRTNGTDSVWLTGVLVDLPIAMIDSSLLFTADTIEACNDFLVKNISLTNDGAGPLNWSWGVAADGWISPIANSGTILPGETEQLLLQLDANPLTDGAYVDSITLNTNDSMRPSFTYVFALEVDGPPNLSADQAEVAFGPIPRNTRETKILTLLNDGCEPIFIDSVRLQSSAFTTNVSAVYLPEDFSYPVELTFQPAFTGFFVDTLSVFARDTTVRIALSGVAEGALNLEVGPAIVYDTIPDCEGITLDTFFVYNTGDGPGNWSLTNLAVQPGWVSYAPVAGTIAAGDSAAVVVSLDAVGLNNATYVASVDIGSTDPLQPDRSVRTSMHLIGTSAPMEATDSLDFGRLYYTTDRTDTIWIQNMACDTFEVLSLEVGAPFFPEEVNFDLLPRDSFPLVVKVDPTVIDFYQDTLVVIGETDTLYIQLVADAIDYPKVDTITRDQIVINVHPDVDPTSLADSTWFVWGAETGFRTGTYGSDMPGVITFTPDQPFFAGEQVDMTFNGWAYTNGEKAQPFVLDQKSSVTNPTDAVFTVRPAPINYSRASTVNTILHAEGTDLDRDGDMDLVVYETTGGVYYMRFYEQTEDSLQFRVQYIRADGLIRYGKKGDFNNDGKTEHLSYSRGDIDRYVETSPWNYSRITESALTNPNNIWIADISADGDLDIILDYNSSLFILQNRVLSFTGVTGPSYGAGRHYGILPLLDFDKDGLPNIILQNASTTTSLRALNYSDNAFSFNKEETYQTDGNHSTGILNHGYFDNNEFPDYILARNYVNNQIILNDTIQLGKYASVFSNRDHRHYVSDIDGDGDQDLFSYQTRNTTNNSWDEEPLTLFLNDGNGNFTESQRGAHLGLRYGENLADWDGDGDLDIMFFDHDYKLWIAYNGNSNADLVIQDSLVQEYRDCSVDSTYAIQIANAGDSLLVWQVLQPTRFPAWLTVDTTYGQVPAGDSLALNVNINTDGLESGVYAHNILLGCNDPDRPLDTLEVQFELISDTLLFTSHTELDFGLVDTAEVITLELTLTNDGCEDVTVDGSLLIGEVFATPSLPVMVPSFGTATVSVSLDPTALVNYQDTLTLTHPFGAFVVALSARGCYVSPVTRLREQVCSADSVRIDSLLFQNTSGCDSLVLTTYHLPGLEVCPELAGYDSVGKFEGHCYYLSLTSSDFFSTKAEVEALMSSNGLHGYMVSINTEAENDFIYSIAPSAVSFIGLEDGNGYGDEPPCEAQSSSNRLVNCWQWHDGSTIASTGYHNWFSVEPNNYQGNEDVGNFYGRDISTAAARGKWNDIISTHNAPHILEVVGSEQVVTFRDSIVCEIPLVSASDTIVLTGLTGCDSMIVIRYELPNIVSTNGLVAHYKFRGNASDESENGYDGEVLGPVSTHDQYGLPDEAYDFDGSNDYIRIINPFYQFTNRITVSTWMNVDEFKIGSGIGQSQPNVDNSSTNMWQLHGSVDGSIYFFVLDNGIFRSSGASQPLQSGWNHVTGVADSHSTRLYINGELVSTGPGIQGTINNNPNSEIHFGKDPRYSSGRWLDGKISDTHIYSRVLSDEEIQLLYELQSDAIVEQIIFSATCFPNSIGRDTIILESASQYGCDSTVLTLTSVTTAVGIEDLLLNLSLNDTIQDLTGWNHTPTIIGDPVFTTGRTGTPNGAILFDGNDYLTLDNHADRFRSTQDFTISSWFRTGYAAGDNQHQLFSGNNTTGTVNVMRLGTAANGGIFYSPTANNHIVAGAGYNDNEFHHLTLTVRSDTAFVYVDGELIDQNGAFNVDWSQADRISIGQEFDNTTATDYWRGLIDDFRFFARAVSADEVRALYYEVVGESILVAQDTLLNFGTLTVGDSAILTTYLTNTTCDTLTFTNLSIAQQQFRLEDTLTIIPPYGTVMVPVSFRADDVLLYVGQLYATTTTDTVNILLQGAGCIPRPNLVFTDNTALCTGQAFTVTTSLGGPVQWNTGQIADTISVTDPGLIVASFSNNNGCQVFTDSVEITRIPDAEVVVSGFSTICRGDATELMAVNATQYAWSTGAATETVQVTPDASGWISALLTNAAGCTYADSVFIQVIDPTPPAPVTNMVPADAAIDVAGTPLLSWLPDAFASTFDVYIWPVGATKPALPTYGNINQITITANNLQLNTEYNWQVHAKNSCNDTPGPVQTFTTISPPNLRIANIQVPNGAFSGTTVTISWEVINDGPGITGPVNWFDNVYLSEDNFFHGGGVDPLVGSKANVTALSAGQAYQNTVTFALPPGISGDYFIYVRTDANRNLDETNEADNTNVFGAYLSVTLTPPPDLQVTSILTPNNSFSGQMIPVSFTVTNLGVGQTINGQWRDRIGYSTSAVPDTDVSWGPMITRTGALEPNAAYTVTTNFELPANVEDTLYLHVETDANDDVYEFINNGNNVSVSNPIRMILTPPADLEPASLEMVGDDVSIDEEVTLHWQINNIGGNGTEPGTWKDLVYFSRADTFSAASATPWFAVTRGAPVASGAGYTVATDRRVPNGLAGDYNLFLWTDADNDQFEFTDTNNIIGPVPFTVRTPDLTLDSIICTDTLVAGTNTEVLIWARNAGAGDVVRSRVKQRLYLTPAIPFDRDSVITTYNTLHETPWLSGDSSTLFYSLELTAELEGDYFLYGEVNPNEEVFENGEVLNNFARLSDTLHLLPSPKPDLIVSSLLSFDTLYAGVADTFAYTVRNIGTGPTSGSYRNRLSFWRDGTEQAVLGTEVINTVTNEFEDYTLTRLHTVPVSLITGYYQLRAKVDVNDDQLEVNDANNVGIMDSVYVIAQPPSDLTIATADTLPDTLLTETVYTLTARVQNLGPAVTVGNWTDRLVRSEDAVYDANDEVLQTVRRNNLPLAADSSYALNLTFTTPLNWGDAPIYYIVKTDVLGTTNDTDGGNNQWVLSNNPGDGPAGPGDGGSNGVDTIGSTTTIQSPIRDIAVTILSAPNEVAAGQPITVIYEVTNRGEVDLDQAWTDRLNLSPSPNPGGIELVSRAKHRVLPVDSSYTDTLTADVALATTGNLYQVVRTDATNVLYEHEAEGNNAASAILSVEQSAPADLEVINVTTAVDTVTHGELLSLTWITRNNGQNPVNGQLAEAVYASADDVWDAGDVLLSNRRRNYQIPALGQVNGSAEVSVNEVPYGFNHFIIRTDVFDNIPEDDEANNFTTGPRIFVDLKLLPLDMLVDDRLNPAQKLFYRTPIPDSLRNESLVIEVVGDTINGFNEGYVSYEDLPSRFDYDRRHQEPFRGRQSVVVPDINSGNYFSLSYGTTRNNSAQDVTLEARIQPFELTRIDANRGANTGSITVRLQGARFEEGMDVYLDNDTLNSLLQAIEVEIVDPTVAYAIFNLNAGAYIDRQGIDPGFYDVILVKPTGERAVLTAGFEVFEGTSEEVSVNVIYPVNIRPFRAAEIKIEYQNTSGRDIEVPKFVVVSMDDVPIGRDENQIRSISGWVWGDNVPRLFREILVELPDPERPDSDILRAGASGVITLYAWILDAGSYRMKIIEVQEN